MAIQIRPISSAKLEEYLQIPDLSLDPGAGERAHAINLVYRKMRSALEKLWPETEVRVIKRKPIVSDVDCYDNLLVPADNVSRSSTYTHWVDLENCLQTHTSAQIPAVLRELSLDYENWEDVTILVPGLAYRRDVYDKTHLGVLHQMDIWRIVKNKRTLSLGRGQGEGLELNKSDLLEMVQAIAEGLAPGWDLRIENNPHPYTNGGIEVNVTNPDGRDIEILECGLLGKDIIKRSGMDPEEVSGLASGLGLDRLVMTLKDIPDVRYLRSDNSRIAAQMYDLEEYRPVSLQPAILRDLSYSVPEEYVEEDISQEIESAIGADLSSLESVQLLSETEYSKLNPKVREKLGIKLKQKNVLVRITLRDLNRTLTKKEANQIYEKIYKKVNHGDGGY
jgi:phenylalanyl-tRNA synthetase alpha chain